MVGITTVRSYHFWSTTNCFFVFLFFIFLLLLPSLLHLLCNLSLSPLSLFCCLLPPLIFLSLLSFHRTNLYVWLRKTPAFETAGEHMHSFNLDNSLRYVVSYMLRSFTPIQFSHYNKI